MRLTASFKTKTYRETVLGLGFYALLLVTTCLYWPGLHGPLILDDGENLKPLQDMEIGFLTWQEAVFSNGSGQLGRPLAMLSFVFNQLTSGGDVEAFKYTNLLLHLLCGTLIFWLSVRLLREIAIKHALETALLVTALWLVSPMLVSTVLYVVQRMTQLSALFVLCGLLSYVIGRQNWAQHRLGSAALILSCFLIWMPLAAFSKENGLLLPLLALMIELFFFRFYGGRFEFYFLLTLFTLFLFLPVIGGTAWLLYNFTSLQDSYLSRDFSLYERLLTQPRILLDYIFALVLPNGAQLGLFHDDYLKSTTWLSPPSTLLALSVWIAVIIGAWLSRKGYYRFIFFGLIFFLAGHAMESSIFPLELYFEHRNYLPAFGIFLSLVLSIYGFLRNVDFKRSIVSLVLIIPIVYTIACYQRIISWQNWDTLLLTSFDKHPNSPRLMVEVANYYGNSGDLPQAFNYLEQVTLMKPEWRLGIMLNRFILYCTQHATIPATEYQSLAAIDRLDASNYTKISMRNLVNFIAEDRCSGIDVNRLISIIRNWLASESLDYSTRWHIHLQFARLLDVSGKSGEAIVELKKANTIYPDRLGPGFQAIQIQLKEGNLEDAYNTFLELKKNSNKARIKYVRMIESYEEIFAMIKSSTKNDRDGN